MKTRVIIKLFFCIFLIAVITVPATGCKSKTTRIIHTPHPSIIATAEPTEEINPTETPEGTTAPDETPEATQSGTPTATPSDSTPTPTSEATPTASPEPSPTPVPTDTAQPTATPTQPPASSPTSVATPTPTPTMISTPAPSQTPVPNTVYFQNIGNQKIGNSFSIQVRIYNTNEMAYASYDVRFDSSILSYKTTNSSSAVGDGTGLAFFSLDPGSLGDNGLLRILVDYGAYAEAHGGTGVSGSGYLCYINFSAIAAGTSALNFVSGQGNLPGELELIKADESLITPVSWSIGSVTVVN